MIKRWILPTEDKEIIDILAEECGISTLTAAVLTARGHTTYADAMRFLVQEDELDKLASPFDLKDMKRAAERIHAAVDEFEKITIYGDYDCDGVTSTAVLYTYLTSIGANVDYYIPARDGEGYGLNKAALKQIKENDGSLVITVDNGINAIDEIAYANSLGLETVITDHHYPGEAIPNAYAVVNPNRSDDLSGFKPLAGVGVAFKLVAALENGDYQTSLEYFSDIVAIGTVGDIVPLTGENRTIVKLGLAALKYSENAGLNALMEVAGVNPNTVTAQNAAFSIIPRINAAGRMGHAGLAVSLLLCEDKEEALEIARELDSLNKKRQSIEASIISDIEKQLDENPKLLDRRLLILRGDNWHSGIIGIICSKMVERYGKPTLLMSVDAADGDAGTCSVPILKGSARSVGAFHLFKSLTSCADSLIKFGGHKMAAGFSLKAECFDAFCESMESYAKSQYEHMPTAVLKIDKVLSPDDLTIEQLEQLKFLEPFGCQNEQPLFLVKNAVLSSITSLSNGKHQRLSLRFGSKSVVTALLFNTTQSELVYSIGATLDLVVNAEINEYNGNTSISLIINDFRPSGFPQDKYFSAKDYSTKLLLGEEVPQKIALASIPTRDESGLVYRFLKSGNGFLGGIDLLYLALPDKNINYCKLLMILTSLRESGLIRISPRFQITLCEVTQKADLNATPIMQRLNGYIG